MKSQTASNPKSDRPTVLLSPQILQISSGRCKHFSACAGIRSCSSQMSNRLRQRQFTSFVLNNSMNLEENL